jgi:hypothetical protein
MPAKKKRVMTKAHKDALAQGRAEGIAVRQYLEALEANAPKRGRRRTPESIDKRLAAIDAALADAGALKRLQLVQEAADLKAERTSLANAETVDLSSVEKGFVKNAKAYGQRKGISYGSWRKVGVPADVLKKAGITRGG